MPGDVNRRKQTFIDPGFQIKFIVRFCALVVAVAFVVGIGAYAANRATTTVAFEDLRVVVKSTTDFIMPELFAILVIVTVFAGIAAIAIMLVASHKIAGPLYRLRAELKKMTQGEISSSINVRSGDQLQAFVDETEQMRRELCQKVIALKAAWNEVKIHIPQDGENAERMQRLDAQLEWFKTE